MQIVRNRGLALTLLLGLCIAFSGCQRFTKSFSMATKSKLVPGLNQTERLDDDLEPLEEATICIATAKQVGEAGHLTEAIRLYEKALALTPENSEINLNLAPLYAQANSFDKSIACYNKCMAQKGSEPDFANNFAWTLMQANRLQEADSVARQAANQHPGFKPLVSTLAMIQYRLGNRDASLELFTRAGSAGAAHHNIAVLDIDAGDREQAVSHLQKALRLHSDPATIELARAVGIQ